jgi:hypothetical protein
MSVRSITRRQVIADAARAVPVAGLALLAARTAFAAGCADPDDSLRSSLHYTEASTDAQKICAACGFFTPGSGGGAACGNCNIFSGPANPKGHCDSWSAKS